MSGVKRGERRDNRVERGSRHKRGPDARVAEESSIRGVGCRGASAGNVMVKALEESGREQEE